MVVDFRSINLGLLLLLLLNQFVLATEKQEDPSQKYIGFRDSAFCSTTQGIIQDACGATFNTVEETNHLIRPVLKELVTTDYFKYYKVDLTGSNCPFFDDQNGMCGNRACSVDTIEDESELPEFWRTQYLGKLAKDSYMSEDEWESSSSDMDESESCILDNADDSKFTGSSLTKNTNDRNYCYPEDESTGSLGVYVSLPDNPERFTGYSGAHAHKVWRAVYQENCFGYFGDNNSNNNDDKSKPVDQGFSQVKKNEHQLGKVIEDSSRYEMREVGGEVGREAMNTEGEQCMEQRLFYRLLSGMQASVSTHLCYEYLNKTTGKWGPNIDCFMPKVGNHPERVSNLYFNYALVSRAVAKLRNYIDNLYFCRDDIQSDQTTRRQLLKLSKIASRDEHNMFNETQVFATPEAKALKSEFRKRVKNVNALMSCVGCDRCRLWSKLQTAGYGTALKILFELPEKPDDDRITCAEVLSNFRRSELVALINTYDRLSKSVEAVEYFRNTLQGQKEQEEQDLKKKWDDEWGNVWYAIKFIFRSYIDFPKNMWRLFIHYANSYWNRFIGRDDYLSQQYYSSKLEL